MGGFKGVDLAPSLEQIIPHMAIAGDYGGLFQHLQTVWDNLSLLGGVTHCAAAGFFEALISREPSADVMSMADLSRDLAAVKKVQATDAERLRSIWSFTRKHQFLVGARTVLGWAPTARAAKGY
jgi:hypothetical protein